MPDGKRVPSRTARALLGPALAGTALVLLVPAPWRSGNVSPEVARWGPYVERAAHAGHFAIVGYLAARASPTPGAFPLGVVLAFAALTEAAQALIGRDADLADFAADAGGAAVGFALGRLVEHATAAEGP